MTQPDKSSMTWDEFHSRYSPGPKQPCARCGRPIENNVRSASIRRLVVCGACARYVRDERSK